MMPLNLVVYVKKMRIKGPKSAAKPTRTQTKKKTRTQTTRKKIRTERTVRKKQNNMMHDLKAIFTAAARDESRRTVGTVNFLFVIKTAVGDSLGCSTEG
jgi:hypothetical protein